MLVAGIQYPASRNPHPASRIQSWQSTEYSSIQQPILAGRAAWLRHNFSYFLESLMCFLPELGHSIVSPHKTLSWANSNWFEPFLKGQKAHY
jgi:hypothetical protein